LYGLAAVPFLGFVLWYQDAAFGSPFTTSYAQKFSNEDSAGLSPDRLPDPRFVLEIFVGVRGLIFTPILLVGLWYLVRLARGRPGPLRTEAVVGLTIFVVYLLLQASWPNPWGGEMPGPRYLSTAMPFLVTGIAAAWRERSQVVYVAVGALSMGLATITFTLIGAGTGNIVGHIDNLTDHGLEPTLFTLAIGPLGWIPHVVLGGVALVAAGRAAVADRAAGATDAPS